MRVRANSTLLVIALALAACEPATTGRDGLEIRTSLDRSEVWVGEPTRFSAWVWAALSPTSGLRRNSEGKGWTTSYALLIHPGDIFVAATLECPRVATQPGKYLRGCSKIDWLGGREVSGL